MVIESTCRQCGGEGTTSANNCTTCNGKGTIKKQRTAEITIPAGVDNGTNLKVPSKGEPGEKGGTAGHLFIKLEVEEDPIFKRDGNDVHIEAHINLSQAMLGGSVTIPTVEGNELEVTVPVGTQPGERRVLKGKGLKKLGSSGYGNQYIHFVVHVPKTLSEEQKKLIKEFGKTEPKVSTIQASDSSSSSSSSSSDSSSGSSFFNRFKNYFGGEKK
jgi:molecular chaperone DnaJ